MSIEGINWEDEEIASKYKLADRFTAKPAKRLIEQSGLLQRTEKPLVILDNACGTGIVTAVLHDMLDQDVKDRMQITCGDFSSRMIQSVQEMIATNKWKGIEAQVVDGQKMGLSSEHFTHVLTNMGIFLMPDKDAALNEIFRVLKAGGICGISTWSEAGWVYDVQGAIATIHGAPAFPNSETFLAALCEHPWNQIDFIDEELRTHGYEHVRIESLDTLVQAENAKDYVGNFMPMMRQFLKSLWSKADLESFVDLVEPAFLKFLNNKYGEEQAFSIPMRAIIAIAQKPAF